MMSMSNDKKTQKKGVNFSAAFIGLKTVFNNERSFRIELVVGFVTVFTCLFLGLSNIEWAIIIICIGSVLALEIANTIVEDIMDFIHPDFDPRVGKIKDMGSALVLVTCFVAVIVAIFIMLPKLGG